MKSLILASALILAGLAPRQASAIPAAEYGPEFEARFLERCVASLATETTCRRFMEQLQARLGYPLFLELAATSAEILERVVEDRLATDGMRAAPAASIEIAAAGR